MDGATDRPIQVKNHTFLFSWPCASGLFISIVPIAWLLIPVIFASDNRAKV